MLIRNVLRWVATLSILGAFAIGTVPNAAAQDETGEVFVQAWLFWSPGNGDALDAVCFRLQGENYDDVQCTVAGPNVGSAAEFKDLPFGNYELTLDSVAPGCSTSDVPMTIEVDGTEPQRLDLGVTCEFVSVTVHVAECETGIGNGIFEECHENVLAGAKVIITGPPTDLYYTDESGIVSVQVVPGTSWIQAVLQADSDYVGVYAYCADEQSGEVLFNDGVDVRFPILVRAGGEIVCDIYELKVGSVDGDADGNGGTDTPVTLPSTGVSPVNDTSRDSLMLVLAALGSAGIAIGLRQRPVR